MYWAHLLADWLLTLSISRSSYIDGWADIVSYLASVKIDCVSKYLPPVFLKAVAPQDGKSSMKARSTCFKASVKPASSTKLQGCIAQNIRLLETHSATSNLFRQPWIGNFVLADLMLPQVLSGCAAPASCWVRNLLSCSQPNETKSRKPACISHSPANVTEVGSHVHVWSGLNLHNLVNCIKEHVLFNKFMQTKDVTAHSRGQLWQQI